MERKHRYLKFQKAAYAVEQVVPVSAIYECSECENITAFKKGERFTGCDVCHAPENTWYRTNQVLHFVSKNLNTEFNRLETFGIFASDWVAEFVGSWTFIFLFLLFMTFWVSINIYAWSNIWDPYPFILLNLILSTIAALQAPLILMSQNRQAQKSELRAELDYQTNLNTEKNVAEVLSLLREIREEQLLLKKKTDEVLEKTHGKLEKSKQRKRRAVQTESVLKEAGIDVVHEESE